MMTPEQVLSTYESMTALTAQMVTAARDGDWQHVQALENQVSGHVGRLRTNGASVVMEGPGRQRKVALIQKMLEDDRVIRDLAMPWMQQLASLISSTRTERRVVNAYGSV
jgi:flagellar protein FliT